LSARQAVLEEDLHARTQTTVRGPRLEEKSAGTSRRQGRITKAGNAPARWIVGEAVHHAFLPSKVSTQLTLRQQGLATQARELSWKLEVWRHKRGGISGTAA
jgi:transposase